MNILTRHFIHLYFLAEFEVFFYIYYIMPYEKTLIYGIFKIDSWTDELPLQNITHNIGNKCDGYDTEFDDYNGKLIDKCLYFIYIINGILCGIFIHDIMKIRLSEPPASPRKQTFNSSSSLVSFGSSNNIAEMKKSDEPVTEINCVYYYWKNSEFLSEIIKTIQFIILVGVFEYFFFTTVVDKYKIVNSKTLICKLLDEI